MADFDISEGVELYEAENFTEALTFFLSFNNVKTMEESAKLAYFLGLSAIKLDNFELAIDALEQVVTTSSNEKKVDQCRLLLSIAYAKTNRLKLAEAELQFLQRSQTDHSLEVFNALGFIAFEKGDTDSAIDYYEQFLANDPKNNTAMNSLGYILAETERDIPRALVLCRQASDAKPDYAPYLDSLAWVYHKMNKPNEAKKIITQAKEAMSESRIIKEHYDKIFNV